MDINLNSPCEKLFRNVGNPNQLLCNETSKFVFIWSMKIYQDYSQSENHSNV